MEKAKIPDKPIPTLSNDNVINKNTYQSHIDAENKRRERIYEDIKEILCNTEPSTLEKIWLLISHGDTVIKLAYYVVLIIIKIKGLK